MVELISRKQTHNKEISIIDNIRLLGVICDYCKKENIERAIVRLDFTEVFDI